MKFNLDWFYEELKDALRTLNLGWGDKHLVSVEANEAEGTLTFKGNGRSVTITICEGAA